MDYHQGKTNHDTLFLVYFWTNFYATIEVPASRWTELDIMVGIQAEKLAI